MENIELITHKLLESMVDTRLTDVHVELHEKTLKITQRRYKQTIGVHTESSYQIFNYLKHLAHFDVTRRGSQTGVFERVIKNRSYHFRFSAIELPMHKSGVIRLLNVHAVTGLESITDDQEVLLKVERLMKVRSGIVLFTGKTGSGKSTSLYYFVHFLCKRMVYTLENPIERINESWVQLTSTDPIEDVGNLLRHDPDVIVLGEIRSEQEIKALVKAGLSGHCVMSTMHAGSVSQAIRRLVDMGATVDDLNEMLAGIIHQEMVINETGGVHIAFDIKDSSEIKVLISKSSFNS